MEEKKKLVRYKWTIYITIMIGIVILQKCTAISKIDILGGSPNLLLYAVSVIAMLDGCDNGAGAGLAAGLLMDAVCAPAEGFYTVAYVLCGILVSTLTSITYRKTYFVSLLFWLVSSVVCALLYYVFFMLIVNSASPVLVLKMLPGEILASVLFTVPVYFSCAAAHRRFSTKDE